MSYNVKGGKLVKNGTPELLVFHLPGEEPKPGRLGAGLPVRHADLQHGAYPVDLASWGHPGDRRASGEGGPQLKTPALGEFHD